jgi:hypothetical protein
MQRIRDRLIEPERQPFVGRADELAALRHALTDDGAQVTQVYGIGGIGKTSLLNAFADEARQRGCVVVQLDCRDIQPSEKELLKALNTELGRAFSSFAALADYLAQLDARVVIALDTYEGFQLMDTWLREVFVPSLPDNARVFFFGREAPAAAWKTDWQGAFHCLHLWPLSAVDAAQLLREAGVAPLEAGRINQVVKGHPLGLKMAAAAVVGQPGHAFAELDSLH